jgi:three-Cys-motif partner protein
VASTVCRLDNEQLDIFSSFYEAGPQNWGSRPKPPPTDLAAPQLPIATAEGLVPHGEIDGVLARQITPHSLKKQGRVFRYADTVSMAMKNKFKVWWVDLFAGPGTVYERHGSHFQDGIPLQVVNGLKHPLDGYVFNDISKECVGSLRTLLGNRPRLFIERGDANDQAYLEQLLAPVPRDALVIAYLDPEGLHLHLETLRFLAWRFRTLDFLLNVPVQAIHRAIRARALAPVRPVLEHPDPSSLIEGRLTSGNIRAWFQSKLDDMGYPPHLVRGHEIRSEGNKAPQYDLILASRNKKAPELYDRANQIDADGQRGMDLAV